MTSTEQNQPASIAFAQYFRQSVLGNLKDCLPSRRVVGYFMEPDNIPVPTLNRFQLGLSCEEVAFRAERCIQWEQTPRSIRERLGRLNLHLEERGLVVAVAVFYRKEGPVFQRIYRLSAVTFDDGTCVASSTWEQMCEVWRRMTVPERIEVLKQQKLARSMWEIVLNMDEEVVS